MKKDLGQLFITGITGTNLKQDEAKFLEAENIGGVLLTEKNYESPGQFAELVNHIQRCREEYPLFIGVDQEGGRVSRLGPPFSKFPAPLELSLLDSPKIVYHVAKIMADELCAVGVNLNFAPVCDILSDPHSENIGDRAYGRDHETVSKYISSVIRGLQTNGIMSCAKHFPGHGATNKDSHRELPIIKKNLAEIKENELQPFVKAVKARVDFVMLGHLVVEGIDPDFPCSLSEKAYHLLRADLKYGKIACTDDLTMGAITTRFGVTEAAALAVKAGADILIYRSIDQTAEALKGLQEELKTKRIKNEVILARANNVSMTKKINLKEYNPIYIPEISKKINQRSNQVFLEELGQKIEAASKSS